MAPSTQAIDLEVVPSSSLTIRAPPVLRKAFVEPVETSCGLAYAVGMDEVRVNIDKPWLSVADICEYMDVSTFVVTSVLRSGELPAVKFGREWRISKDDFETWINTQRRRSDTSDPSVHHRA